MAVYHISFEGVPMSVDENKPADLSNVVTYQTSQRASRLFCERCSSHMFFRATKESGDGGFRYCIAAGALERVEGIAKVGYHIHVKDTLDGGLANHMITYDGEELKRYTEQDDSESLPLDWSGVDQVEGVAGREQTLHAHCQCKAIQFSISRPSDLSTTPRAAFPDLLYSHRTTDPELIKNKDDEKWWLVKLNGETKYLAGHCVCTTCRLSSGFEVQSWAFIPRFNISVEGGSTLDLGDQRIPGLVQYQSSEANYREFCGSCGATVFAWNDGEPDLVKVSVGVLASRSGARAEEWLIWNKERVAFVEEAVSRSTAESLVKSLRNQ
ncbi:hypothetical protein AX16_005979 [Volvariella volvacea WC 439]|nr:hypothetical protein AX16_005979 [Volvariella volvacea WC 439]